MSLDILEAIARRDLAVLEHRTDRLTAVSHLWGPAGLVGELASLQQADTPERLERYVARISATPAFYDAELEIMREGIADGVTAPRIVAERALAQTERLIEAGAEDSPVLAPVPADDADARSRLAAAVANDLLPALERYRDGVRDYLPHATETIGLADLPGGDAMYAAQILSWTTLELDAQEVHELGVADLEKIQDERARAAEILGHPDAATAEAAIAADPAFRFDVPGPAQGDRGGTGPPELGRWRPRGSARSRAPTARSGSSRSSARPTCRSRSTTSRPRTAPGRASTT